MATSSAKPSGLATDFESWYRSTTLISVSRIIWSQVSIFTKTTVRRKSPEKEPVKDRHIRLKPLINNRLKGNRHKLNDPTRCSLKVNSLKFSSCKPIVPKPKDDAIGGVTKQAIESASHLHGPKIKNPKTNLPKLMLFENDNDAIGDATKNVTEIESHVHNPKCNDPKYNKLKPNLSKPKPLKNDAFGRLENKSLSATAA
jgi:hypothetical protein